MLPELDKLPTHLRNTHRPDPDHRYRTAIIGQTSLMCLHLVDHCSIEIDGIKVMHSMCGLSRAFRLTADHEIAFDFISSLLLRPDFKMRCSLDAKAHALEQQLLLHQRSWIRATLSLGLCNIPKNRLSNLYSNTTFVGITVAGATMIG